MIRRKKDGLLIVLSGPSGAGKDTVCRKLLEQNDNLWLSISMTTRSPRPNEKDGVDYYYVTPDIFEKKIAENGFLEHAEVYNDLYYGTPKDEVMKHIQNGIDVVLVIDIAGAKQIKESYPSAICIFIMPPSMKELKRRLVNRNTETKERILERFEKAYKEVNEVTKYNYVTINDKVESCVDKIQAIILAEKCRVDRIEDVDLGNEEEELHELLTEEKN